MGCRESNPGPSLVSRKQGKHPATVLSLQPPWPNILDHLGLRSLMISFHYSISKSHRQLWLQDSQTVWSRVLTQKLQSHIIDSGLKARREGRSGNGNTTLLSYRPGTPPSFLTLRCLWWGGGSLSAGKLSWGCAFWKEESAPQPLQWVRAQSAPPGSECSS